MDTQTPEERVVDGGEKYFRQLRISSKDPRVVMASAKMEIFLDELAKRMKKPGANPQQIFDRILDIDKPQQEGLDS